MYNKAFHCESLESFECQDEHKNDSHFSAVGWSWTRSQPHHSSLERRHVKDHFWPLLIFSQMHFHKKKETEIKKWKRNAMPSRKRPQKMFVALGYETVCFRAWKIAAISVPGGQPTNQPAKHPASQPASQWSELRPRNMWHPFFWLFFWLFWAFFSACIQHATSSKRF